MNTEIVAYLKYCAKSISTFLAAVAGNAAYDLIESGRPWPSTRDDWVRWGISVLLAAVVYGVPNGPKPAARRRRRRQPSAAASE